MVLSCFQGLWSGAYRGMKQLKRKTGLKRKKNWLALKERDTDKDFSLHIRTRDNWTCQNPKCRKEFSNNHQGLHCSHYWGRSHENTRFDPKNCIALCSYCHVHRWGHGEGRDEYTDYMKQWLGEKEYEDLKIRKEFYKKRDDAADMIYIQQLLSER